MILDDVVEPKAQASKITLARSYSRIVFICLRQQILEGDAKRN